MTKLADELETLAKDATPGKWDFDGTFSDSNYIGTPDADIFMHSSWPLEMEDEAAANVQIVLSLQNNLATIIAALRQPDAVPGDLVERLNWAMGQFHNCQQWHEEPDPDGDMGTLYTWIVAGTDTGDSAAIQSLTAERDAALAEAENAIRYGVENGKERVAVEKVLLAALARVAELEAGLVFIAPAMPVLRDMLKRAKMPKGANKAAELVECISALLEGQSHDN